MGRSKAYRAGKDYFDRVGYRDAPLSGEWAGESMVEIGDDYDIDLFEEFNADDFEAGFFYAAEKAGALPDFD